ncbi:hypothetical protein HJC23_011749 [Cyclotella cryptica]|uniref:Uncharacterized protein n=1 Tax=Cyclotella cryptica TaxID=29204 RepID=A0ABD3PL22_9STRA
MFFVFLLLLLNEVSPLPNGISSFQFPKIKFIGISSNDVPDNVPKRRIEKGEGDDLKQSLEKHCSIKEDLSGDPPRYSLRWEPYLQESYDVANVLFQEIVQVARARFHCYSDSENLDTQITSPRVISCPSMSRLNDLESIATVLRSDKCKILLGLDDVVVELYPSSPSPYLRLSFSTLGNAQKTSLAETENLQTISCEAAIAATESWVDNFLGKYNLCPYTSSVSKAAVGLTSVGIPVGHVHIVAGSTNNVDDRKKSSSAYDVLRAAELVSEFWSETVTLLKSPESDWATSLVVFPDFDNDFDAFVDVCDNVIQPIILATSSTDYIGRAWFHPRYDADTVGHTSVVPGHAVPHKMVQQFIDKAHDSKISRGNKMTPTELSSANNKVRMTPHATINILRRSQLTAATEYEKGLGEKKPTPNSIYVRNALKLNEILKGDENK